MSQDTVTFVPNEAIRHGSSFAVAYPTGRDASFYATDGHYLRSNRYWVQFHGEDATFVFGTDAVTITNESGTTFAAGTIFIVNLVHVEQLEDSIPVDATPQVNALREDLASTANEAGKGASGVGYYNAGDVKFGGADDMQAVADFVHANALWTADAEDSIAATAVEAGAAAVYLFPDGTVRHIDHSVLFQQTPNSFINNGDADYPVTTSDNGRTVARTRASAMTVTIPLQSAQEFILGHRTRIFHKGAGDLDVVCDDATILLNRAADGVVSSPGQGAWLDLVNVGVNEWEVEGATAIVAADVVPPAIESINPAVGSMITADQIIQVRYNEGIQAGAGSITQRESADNISFANDGTIAIGSLTITEGRVLNIPAANARTAGNYFAIRIPAGLVKDLAASPNDCAAVADDTTIWHQVAPAVGATIEFVAAASGYIDPGSTAGATQTKTIPTPANGDMVIVAAAGRDLIPGGPPDSLDVTMVDWTANSNPSTFLMARFEGVSPSNQIIFNTISNRRQAWGAFIIRGPGLDLSNSAGKTNAAEVEPADAPAVVQPTADEFRVAFWAIDNRDLTPTVTALEAAGWVVPVNQNTQQGSSTVGATLVMAYKAMGGSISTSVDPPALGSGNVIYRAAQFTIKKT